MLINGFFHLIRYNELGMVHCTCQGVTVRLEYLQIIMYYVSPSLKLVLILVNSADPDEMPHPAESNTNANGLSLNPLYTENS